MIIQEEDFKLTPIDDSTPKFDLELLYEIKSRNGELKKEFKNVAYGISLDYAIKKIAFYRLNNKHREDAIDLKKYYKEFKEELDALKVLCEI